MNIIQFMKKAIKRSKNLGFYLVMVSFFMVGALVVDFIYDMVNYKYRVPAVAFAMILITAFV